ncbi:aminotransferase class V-fold PLP-dependent enzyme [Nocardioides sp. AE5]|uniref:cysteine desulfurase family protein n=1 Tax=Nocardioides sp. AE5 TaxID=2962573 RepID=UPI0028818C97|nr:aminotransferase class V-fold PLP-dependent enzyme [Nocardioides sp. AE5]MDT0201171.1 aminotransferase class V-fold PLP-dependent enzyme [Nocardioides sp. AE5]
MADSRYFDSASSEPLHPAARDTLLAALEHGYADPRRLHDQARNSRLMLENAREVIANCLAVRADEVTFTPSGTHAVHLGVLGLLAARTRTSDLLVHSAVEHSSVVHAGRWHEARGGRVARIEVDATGRVQPGLPDEPVGVIALQSANHEVGTLQPVAEVAASTDAPLFTDACASAGRVALPEGWAAAAVSAHKWGGPAGVGALLVRKGTRWRNPFPGDDRVDEHGTGFENVPAALAAAAALQAVVAEREETAAHQAALIDEIRAEVARTVPDVEVVGDPDDRLPHLVTFSCLYVDGEALVGELNRRGFSIASGSACTSSALEPSHVLAAMGVLTHGNVRLSLTRDATREDVAAFLAALPDVVRDLRAEAGL